MPKLIKKIMILLSFIFMISKSWAIPPCPKTGYKHNCYGSFFWKSGNKYEGEFQNDTGNGNGKYTHKTGHTYLGEWKNMKRHGLGISTWINGSIHIGEYENNKRKVLCAQKNTNN